MGSGGSGATNGTEFGTEFVTVDSDDRAETTEQVKEDASVPECDSKVNEIVKRKTKVMSAREMMMYFQHNQKAVTRLDRRKKSVSKSSQGTSARGLLQKNQAPRIKIPASKQKTTNINEKRGH